MASATQNAQTESKATLSFGGLMSNNGNLSTADRVAFQLETGHWLAKRHLMRDGEPDHWAFPCSGSKEPHQVWECSCCNWWWCYECGKPKQATSHLEPEKHNVYDNISYTPVAD